MSSLLFFVAARVHAAACRHARAAYLVTVIQRKEPMFNVPPAVLVTVAVLVPCMRCACCC